MPEKQKNTQPFIIDRRTLIKGTAGIGLAPRFPLIGSEGASAQTPTAMPDGFALVSSMRMPLFSVSGGQANDLLTGRHHRLGRRWVTRQCASQCFRARRSGAEWLHARRNAARLQFTCGSPLERNRRSSAGTGGPGRFPGRMYSPSTDSIPSGTVRAGDEMIQVAFVGDIVPGRNVHNKMIAYGDFTHPFLKIAPQMSAYDIAIANLEGNLSSNIPAPTDTHTFSFVSDPAMLEGLSAGRDRRRQSG